MPCSCETPEAPEDPFGAGMKIHRKRSDPLPAVRIGGNEVYRLSYVSTRHVIATAHRRDGSFITEWHMLRDEFDELYERCPGE